MTVIPDWERKALAATLTALAVTGYALHKGGTFPDYANAMEWILGLYITGQAAQQVGLAKFGLVAGSSVNATQKLSAQPRSSAAKPTPAVERDPTS